VLVEVSHPFTPFHPQVKGWEIPTHLRLHLKKKKDPISEMSCSLVFFILLDGRQIPKTQEFHFFL
jgi:hypothetical protein